MVDKIAIIIVDYNGLKDSIECIESIKKSDSAEDTQVIFVDNASKENEAEAIKQMYPEIISIRSEKNEGFSAGNNIGIRKAIADGYRYVMLLNNDTVVAPDMMDCLKKECHENEVAVPKMLYYSSPETLWYDGGEINRWTGNAKHSNMGKQDDGGKNSRYCTFATGCCVMIPTQVFKKTGLLNEDYFMYCEDTDFSFELAKSNVKIRYVPSARLWHKVSASTGSSDSPFCIYYLTRNRFLICKRWKKELRWTAYPFSLLTRYIRMWQCKEADKKKAYMEAIKDAHKGKMGRAEE